MKIGRSPQGERELKLKAISALRDEPLVAPRKGSVS